MADHIDKWVPSAGCPNQGPINSLLTFLSLLGCSAPQRIVPDLKPKIYLIKGGFQFFKFRTYYVDLKTESIQSDSRIFSFLFFLLVLFFFNS